MQVYQSLASSATQARLAEILSAQIPLSPLQYSSPEQRATFLKQLRTELMTAGQVTAVSVTDVLPGTRGTPRTVAAGSITGGALVMTMPIDSGYFATLGLPLLSGRALTDADRDAAGSGVVVNDRLASLFFGEVSVVGRQIRFTSNPAERGSHDSRVIVGVVPSFRGEAPFSGPPIVYVPRAPGASARSILLMRGRVPPQELAPVLRNAVVRLDPDVPLSDVLPLKAASGTRTAGARRSSDATTQLRAPGRVSAHSGRILQSTR